MTITSTDKEVPEGGIEYIDDIIIRKAQTTDAKYVYIILKQMAASAIQRGSGIAYRTVESILQKMDAGKAIIAVTADGTWVGFSYIESWQDGKFVSNSGMIVSPDFRNKGVAKAIKQQTFNLSREMYPNADVFSITSGLTVMRLNTALGFEPVPYSEITTDKSFWAGCKHCVNHGILESQNYKNCLCTAMLFHGEGLHAKA